MVNPFEWYRQETDVKRSNKNYFKTQKHKKNETFIIWINEYFSRYFG